VIREDGDVLLVRDDGIHVPGMMSEMVGELQTMRVTRVRSFPVNAMEFRWRCR